MVDLTLAFAVFNIEDHIKPMIESWLSNMTGQYSCEVVIVFDNPQDKSDWRARQALDSYPHVDQKFLYAPPEEDLYEIRCNNWALREAEGEYIIFLQHDNWMYTGGWDRILMDTFHRAYNPGGIGLLAGLEFDFKVDPPYHRIEVDRPHKPKEFSYHYSDIPLAIYATDGFNRPFAIKTDLLRRMGGLDEAYCPQDWDDTDLAFRLKQEGFQNYYIPFDLKNTFGKKDTMSEETMVQNYEHGRRIFYARYLRRNVFKLGFNGPVMRYGDK